MVILGIFQVSTLEFIKIQSFMLKEKTLNLGLMTTYLLNFWHLISKNHCHIWNKYSRNFQNSKFYSKTKKMRQKISYLCIFNFLIWSHYCLIRCQHPRIFQNPKFYFKKKTLNLEPKLLYLSIFKQEFENNIAIFEIKTLDFVKVQSLVQ